MLHVSLRSLLHTTIFIGLLACVNGCISTSAPYRLLSDEVIGTIKSPPYSPEQVRQAQMTLRRRLAARLSETTIQSELKSFACLLVAQRLDPTSARGENAPSELPCSFDESRRCAHRCKRSRLPRDVQLAPEYAQVAQRHDQILWQDLEALAQSDSAPQWEKYLTDCLSCRKTAQVRRLVCLRDVGGIELTAKRVAHSPLDRWLNQCSSSKDPEVQVLLSYRNYMLTPAEDLSYPLRLDNLPIELQERLTTRATIGEAIRLVRGSLDGERIANLLQAPSSKSIVDEQWIELKNQLKRRLDSPLMPCLEHGLETCISTGQIQLSRNQAARYLKECRLCEYKESILQWRAGITLDLDSIWRSHAGLAAQAIVRHSSPSGLLIREKNMLTRLALERLDDRLIWSTPSEQLHGKELHLWSHTPHLMIGSDQTFELLLASTKSALYALDSDTGDIRWSYRYPFTKSGQIQACSEVYSIPPQLMDGVMKTGGALCQQNEALQFLDHLGDPVLKLRCDPQHKCGSLLGIVKDKEQQKSKLLMSHMTQGQSEKKLSYYVLDPVTLTDTLESYSPTILPSLSRSWLSGQVIKAKHNQKFYFLGVFRKRNRLISQLIDLKSGQVHWKKQIPGRYLINQPASHNTDLMAYLTNTGLYALALDTGDFVYRERLNTKRSRIKGLKLPLKTSLSWRLLGDRLIVLHPLNQAIYYRAAQEKLSKQSLNLNPLDTHSYLTNIDAQWVVVSPSTGRVYGIPPQLDQVIWTWQLSPFNTLDLSRNWALLQSSSHLQLYKVQPRSLDEIAKKNPPIVDPSACALGDRWDCLIQGDALINIDMNHNFTQRQSELMAWFKLVSHARSFKQAKLTKIDAMVAQSAWSASCQWGVAAGCTRLGLFAELGFYSTEPGEPSSGVVKLKAASKYYKRGAELGDAFARERRGYLLEHGRGIPQDYVQARQAYFAACEVGLPYSCARWGFLNELGLGGAPQYATALTAYKRACKDGSAWACERLKQKLATQ